MARFGIWNNYGGFGGNRMFEPEAYSVTPELGGPLLTLRDKFRAEGHSLDTADMFPLHEFEKVIFLDYPTNELPGTRELPAAKKVLLVIECELIHAPNRRRDLLGEFGRVATYNDDLVSQQGYSKLALANVLRPPRTTDFEKKKFATMMAGNKRSRGRGELYSERRKVIRYFEAQRSEGFDLYGPGWDLMVPGSEFLQKVFRKLKVPTIKRPRGAPRSWRGFVDHKIDTLAGYKFCFCYENSSSIPGYISEKIFDCFFAGTVPIYWGAPNVTDYIPKDCFVDRRDFADLRELVSALETMDAARYRAYLESAAQFLLSEKAEPFSSKHFAEAVYDLAVKE